MNIEIVIRETTTSPHDINNPNRVNVYEKVSIKIEEASAIEVRAIIDNLKNNKLL